MKRLALVVAVGLALAVIVAAQALRPPEREPVTPIELPTSAGRNDEPAQATTGRATTRDRKSGRPSPTGDLAPAPQSPPVRGSADDDQADDRSPTRQQPPPPPSRESDGSDDDEGRGDDEADE